MANYEYPSPTIKTWLYQTQTLTKTPALSAIMHATLYKAVVVVAFSLYGREDLSSITPLAPFFLFFKWRPTHALQFPLFQAKDQSTVAQQTEVTVAQYSPVSCMWACFPDGFQHYAWTAWSAHSGFVGSWVLQTGYPCLAVACCHLYSWQNGEEE